MAAPQHITKLLHAWRQGNQDALAQLETEKIADDGDIPIWLPDSQRLLFVREGKIFIADTRTKKSQQIFAPGANETAEYFMISRDSRTIYYCHLTIDSDIWLMKY